MAFRAHFEISFYTGMESVINFDSLQWYLYKPKGWQLRAATRYFVVNQGWLGLLPWVLVDAYYQTLLEITTLYTRLGGLPSKEYHQGL